MAAPQASAQLLQGGAALVRTRHKPVLCKAFKNAVKNWCRDLGSRKGNFNDYFYRSLSNIRPQGQALAQNLSREVGGLFYKNLKSGADIANQSAGRFVGLVTNPAVSGGSGMAARAAQAAGNIFENGLGGVPTGMSTARNISRTQGIAARAISRSYGTKIGTRWADGVFRSTGRCLEIKGPSDSPRPGQLTDQQKMGNGKFPAVVSCKTCNLNCSKQNQCPTPLKTV